MILGESLPAGTFFHMDILHAPCSLSFLLYSNMVRNVYIILFSVGSSSVPIASAHLNGKIHVSILHNDHGNGMQVSYFDVFVRWHLD
jgi:hypothetical protein